MDARSSILLAITLSLVLHAGVLTYMLFQGNPMGGKPGKGEVAVEVVEMDPEVLAALHSTPAVSSDLVNLVANQNRERTADLQNPNRRVDANQVASDLRDFEAQAFQELQEARDAEGPGDLPTEGTEIPTDPEDRFDWYKENNPEGNVAATFSLGDRNSEKDPKPAYVCEYSGVVVVNIQVNQQGFVESAAVNQGQTTTTRDCLTEASVEYAYKWKFNASSSAPKRHAGTITFTFVNQ